MRAHGSQTGMAASSVLHGRLACSLGKLAVILVTTALIPATLFAQENPQTHTEPTAAAPSPLRLAQAVRIGLERNPQRKLALAETLAAAADVKEARSGLLPRIGFSETATDGNDPV